VREVLFASPDAPDSFLSGLPSVEKTLPKSLRTVSDDSLQAVYSICTTPHTTEDISQLARSLSPGGILTLREPALLESLTEKPSEFLRTEAQLFLALSFASLVDVQIKFLPETVHVVGDVGKRR